MTVWVLFAGLPGTGKSTLAKALAARFDAVILNKDSVREVLFPAPYTDYSEEQDALCMAAMMQAATYLTLHRQVAYIFFDGRTFSTARQRQEVLRAAEHAGAHWRILLLQCAQIVAEGRLAQVDPAHPAKNRGLALYRELRRRFEPMQHAALAVDTTSGWQGQWDAVIRYIGAPDYPSLTAPQPTDILP